MTEVELPLRTPRLNLRAIVESDFGMHQLLFSNPLVVRYLYDEVLEGAALRTHFEKRFWQGPGSEGEWANLAVEHDGRFIGEVGICLLERVTNTAEVGYVFLPECSGHGLASEAVQEVVSFCFEFWNVHRVIARLDARNDRSARLCERLGFRLEAHFIENEFIKGELTSEKVYAILDREWFAKTH
jgi:RimJ/RimL family protein N-acetyltransferase